MITCPHCGADNPSDAILCQECGLPLDQKRPGDGRIAPTAYKDVRDKLARILDGQYEIVDEIGRGGMAIVYKAIDINLERIDAIKVLPVELAYDKEFVERFHREAKTAARLHHPNIITVYTVRAEKDLNFMILKWIEGKSLKQLIKERKTIPSDEAIRLLKDVCSALFFAHKEGVIHRDIKPDNILLDRNGSAIVMDFGIAKAVTNTQLTSAGAFLGTASYMAPEQIKGNPDHRADLYALGVMAYKMFTGRVPFRGKDSYAIHYQHLHDEPLPPSRLNPMLPKPLEDWVLKLLRKDPESRYQSAKEAQDDLEQIEQQMLRPVSREMDRLALESTTSSQNVGFFFKQGLKAFEARDFERSVNLWEKVLSLDPSYIKAIEHIRRARQAMEDQKRVALHLQEGHEHFAKGAFAEAVRSWSKIMAIDADHPEAFHLISQGREKLAAQDKVRGALNAAEEARHKGENAEAARLYAAILADHPANAEALDALSSLRHDLERESRIESLLGEGAGCYEKRAFDQAIAAYEQVFDLHPGHLAAAQAVEKAKDAKEKSENIAKYLKDAERLLREGAIEQARHSLAELAFLAPDNKRVTQKLKEADALLERSAEIASGMARVSALADAGQIEDAFKAVSSLLAAFPESGEVNARHKEIQALNAGQLEFARLVQDGDAAFKSGQDATAVARYEAALAINPDHDAVAKKLAGARERLRATRISEIRALVEERRASPDWSALLALYEEWRRLDPQDTSVAQRCAEVREKQDRQELVTMLVDRGSSLAEEGRWSEARRDWREAQTYDAGNSSIGALLKESEGKADSAPAGTSAGLFEQFLCSGQYVQAGTHAAALKGATQTAATAAISAVQALDLGYRHTRAVSELVAAPLLAGTRSFERTPLVPLMFEDVADVTGDFLAENDRVAMSLLYRYSDELPSVDGESGWEEQEHTQAGFDDDEKTAMFTDSVSATPAPPPIKEQLRSSFRVNPAMYGVLAVVVGAVGVGAWFGVGVYRENQRRMQIELLRGRMANFKYENKLDAVIRTAEEILRIAPGDEEAKADLERTRKRITDLQAQKERDETIKGLLTRLKTESDGTTPDQWLAGMKTAQEILDLDAENLYAKDVLRDLKSKHDKLMKEQNAEKFIADQLVTAKDALTRDDWEPALEAIGQILEIRPEQEEALALKARASELRKTFEDRKKAELVEQEFLSAAKAGPGSPATLAAARRLLQYQPRHPQALKVIAGAESAARERANDAAQKQKLAAALKAASDFLAAAQWDEAIAKANDVLDNLDPDSSEAKAVIAKSEKAKSDAKAAKSQAERIDAAIAKARQEFQKGKDALKFDAFFEAVKQGLALDPDNGELLSLQTQAKRIDAATDREAPGIKLDGGNPSRGTAGKDITIRAFVEDLGPAESAGLQTIVLEYRYKGGSWETKPMYTRTGKYEAFVEGKFLKNAGTINYKITASDKSGNKASSPEKAVEIEKLDISIGM